MSDFNKLDIKEPLYYYLTGNWYKGSMPNFYDVKDFQSTKILESNYELIKAEIESFYNENSSNFKANFTPYKYKEEGWRTINLCAFLLKYPENIKFFPNLYKVASSIPDMLTCQVAVLNPRTRVKAHFGDTNAIIRNHMGIIVPGEYPDLGFRNGVQEKCWKEGKVLAICVAHRHYVWNNTDHKRIILLVDTIHPAYKKEKYSICAGLLAASLLKLISNKFERLKKVPNFITILFHKIFTSLFWIGLKLQDNYNFQFTQLWSKFKVQL